jgi:hypothetical protein
MKPILLIAALFPALFFCSAPAFAQNGAPAATFAQVGGLPTPLQSVSGRFSSLNPQNRLDCPYQQVSGRVVSPRLIQVKEMRCGRPQHDNLLVNVEFSNPADAAQMVTGRHVVIAADFKSAVEDHDPVEFLIAEKARLLAADPVDSSAQPFTSYMICQPPELDGLAKQVGSDLCVQSTIVANLATMGPALAAAARRPARLSPGETLPGDPDAISCRLDRNISDRHLSAIACARNSYWEWYRGQWHDPMSSTPAPP